MVVLDPNIWGPHYWFFLHTISMTYPLKPNAVTKKKYYEFIQNLHIFIPNERISSDFSKLLNSYPVLPYLDNRQSFIRWIWFIHNKINEKLEKKTLTLNEFYIQYYNQYKPTNIKLLEYYRLKHKIIDILIIVSVIITIYYLYDK